MANNGKIVYAYVTADLLHIGHLIHLENSKALAGPEGKLIVGVLTDEATMEKKPKPIISLEERLRLVGALKCVDAAVVQETYSPISNIKRIKPDIHMESNSHIEKEMQEIKEVVESYGGKVIVMPYYPNQSSTQIKNKIAKSWAVNSCDCILK